MHVSLSAGGSPAQASAEVSKLLGQQVPESSTDEEKMVAESAQAYVEKLLGELAPTASVNVSVALSILVARV